MPIAAQDYANETDSKLLKLMKLKQWKDVNDLLSEPEGISMVSLPDQFYNMPLHVAIGYQAPEDLILRTLCMYPDACKVRGTDDWLPLHVAAMWGTPSRVMEALIRAYPPALDDPGEGGIKGRTPRFFSLRFPHSKEFLERPTEEWIRIVEKDIRKAQDCDSMSSQSQKRYKCCDNS